MHSVGEFDSVYGTFSFEDDASDSVTDELIIFIECKNSLST